MNGEFVEALNDCVERLARGESIQDCLSRYPDYANEIRPLLEVSVLDYQGRGKASARSLGASAQLPALLSGDLRNGATQERERSVVAALEISKIRLNRKARRSWADGYRSHGDRRRRDDRRLFQLRSRRAAVLGEGYARKR